MSPDVYIDAPLLNLETPSLHVEMSLVDIDVSSTHVTVPSVDVIMSLVRVEVPSESVKTVKTASCVCIENSGLATNIPRLHVGSPVVPLESQPSPVNGTGPSPVDHIKAESKLTEFLASTWASPSSPLRTSSVYDPFTDPKYEAVDMASPRNTKAITIYQYDDHRLIS